MRDYRKISLTVAEDEEEFTKEVSKAIDYIQKLGYEVEFHYVMNNTKYSATILGYLEK